MRWFLALVLLTASTTAPACSWSVHQRDPATIASIDATAKNRAADSERFSRTLEEAAGDVARAPSQTAEAVAAASARLRKEAANQRALEASEQVRLANWLWREQQKSDKP